jgi:hypothetical protein
MALPTLTVGIKRGDPDFERKVAMTYSLRGPRGQGREGQSASAAEGLDSVSIVDHDVVTDGIVVSEGRPTRNSYHSKPPHAARRS